VTVNIKIPKDVFESIRGYTWLDDVAQRVARWVREECMKIHGRHCKVCQLGALCPELEDIRDLST